MSKKKVPINLCPISHPILTRFASLETKKNCSVWWEVPIGGRPGAEPPKSGSEVIIIGVVTRARNCMMESRAAILFIMVSFISSDNGRQKTSRLRLFMQLASYFSTKKEAKYRCRHRTFRDLHMYAEMSIVYRLNKCIQK
jgi:hypothetical protein